MKKMILSILLFAMVPCLASSHLAIAEEIDGPASLLCSSDFAMSNAFWSAYRNFGGSGLLSPDRSFMESVFSETQKKFRVDCTTKAKSAAHAVAYFRVDCREGCKKNEKCLDVCTAAGGFLDGYVIGRAGDHAGLVSCRRDLSRLNAAIPKTSPKVADYDRMKSILSEVSAKYEDEDKGTGKATRAK